MGGIIDMHRKDILGFGKVKQFYILLESDMPSQVHDIIFCPYEDEVIIYKCILRLCYENSAKCNGRVRHR